MVAYSFRPRFVGPILAGEKHQTIRAVRTGRSRHARVGETLQIYTGMRTRNCRLLGTSVCVAKWPITLQFGDEGFIEVNSHRITTMAGMCRFAKKDGFENWWDMERFWQEAHPALRTERGWVKFTGVIVFWDPKEVRRQNG